MPHIHELYDLTVTVFILHPTEKKFCLHLHKKLNVWMPVGGHVELNEDPEQALIHEMQEEAGLNPDQYTLFQDSKRPKLVNSKSLPLPFNFEVHEYDNGHKHIDLEYIAKSKTVTLKPLEGESEEIGWFTIDEIKKLWKSKEVFDDVYEKSEWIAQEYFKL